MQGHKKKTWKKNSIFHVGFCKYCKKELVNTDSFVVFLSVDIKGEREKAHYECMRKADEDKTYENESKFDW